MKRLTIAALSLLAMAFVIGCEGSNTDQGEAPQTDAMPASAKAGEMAEIDAPAPDFTLTDTNGKQHSLSDFKGKYVVLEWIKFDCPFVKKHYSSGNMPALQANYQEKEVVWLSICSSAPGKQGHFAGEALTSRMTAEDWQATAYLNDDDGTVGKMYDAKTTPHMYVIDPEGVLRYNGAIDDTPSTKVADIEGATCYVSSALDALMADQPVETKITKAYGCSVKYP